MRRGWSDGGCPYPGRPDRVSERSDRPHRKVAVDRPGVSSGHSTGGDHDRREGPNVSPRDDPDRLAIGASTAAIPPCWRACRGGETVKPSDPPTERSADPASPETFPHPARAECLWEDFLSRDNLARAQARSEGETSSEGSTTPPHLPAEEHRDARPARAAQPVHRRLVRLLRAGRDALGVRRVRRVASAQAAPGPLEGVEAVRRAAPQPASPRHPRLAGPPMGGQPEGILAACRLPSAPACPAEPLLGRSRPGGDQRSNSSPPGALANRRMRTRTSGDVGGGGVTPPPNRSVSYTHLT